MKDNKNASLRGTKQSPDYAIRPAEMLFYYPAPKDLLPLTVCSKGDCFVPRNDDLVKDLSYTIKTRNPVPAFQSR